MNFAEDARDFYTAAAMLKALGVTRCRLLTNNPVKRQHLVDAGIDVAEQLLTGVYVTPANHRYLSSKAVHAGHVLRHGLGPAPTPTDPTGGNDR